MYIPEINSFEDQHEIIAFMREFSFANLVTQVKNKPYATPLPFIVETQDDQVHLMSHCARENIHWQFLEDQVSLIIFQEPHAFISTELYERESVPTWNYMAVHASGNVKIIEDWEVCYSLLERTISSYQESFHKEWSTYSLPKIKSLMKGIVCFEMYVDELEAKAKLSQNKTARERKNIYSHLLDQKDSIKSRIGFEMSVREDPIKKDNL